MRVLAIETATEACSAALFDNGALVDSRHEVLGAALARQFGNHRDQPLGMAAAHDFMERRHPLAAFDQRDRASGGRGFDDERAPISRRD